MAMRLTIRALLSVKVMVQRYEFDENEARIHRFHDAIIGLATGRRARMA